MTAATPDPGQDEQQHPDWLAQIVASARASGIRVDYDAPDSVMLAEARNLFTPGSPEDCLAASLAEDLAKRTPGGVTRETCAALARSAANLRGMILIGADPGLMLCILSAAAAKLEMQVKP